MGSVKKRLTIAKYSNNLVSNRENVHDDPQ
uniref:Uncharacterized protein n=1 Tax=Rhizophora mucronata TaxID=61149 RepID=A0A2P2QII8_RHIMU